VNRRFALLPLALVTSLSLVLAACNSAPAVTMAPALTDPKAIVHEGAASLAKARSLEFTGTFTGSLQAPGLGRFDLTTVKLAGAFDVATKAVRVNLDAPSLLGTRFDAIVIGDTAYYRVAGALAAVLSGSADKYTRVGLSGAVGDPMTAITDVAKLVAQVDTVLAALPLPLTKAPDEACGDVECYHVTVGLTGEQLGLIDPAATIDGSATIDVWTRKLDYRPAKIALSVVSADLGTVGMTIELRYDAAVSVVAPAADQIVP
jgi:hypothetical protein